MSVVAVFFLTLFGLWPAAIIVAIVSTLRGMKKDDTVEAQAAILMEKFGIKYDESKMELSAINCGFCEQRDVPGVIQIETQWARCLNCGASALCKG